MTIHAPTARYPGAIEVGSAGGRGDRSVLVAGASCADLRRGGGRAAMCVPPAEEKQGVVERVVMVLA